MSPHVPSVVVLKSLTLILGGLITYYAATAARRTGARSLRLLAVGFAFVTLGALIAGGLDLIVAVGRQTALVVESGFTAIGFAIILYSLFAK